MIQRPSAESCTATAPPPPKSSPAGTLSTFISFPGAGLLGASATYRSYDSGSRIGHDKNDYQLVAVRKRWGPPKIDIKKRHLITLGLSWLRPYNTQPTEAYKYPPLPSLLTVAALLLISPLAGHPCRLASATTMPASLPSPPDAQTASGYQEHSATAAAAVSSSSEIILLLLLLLQAGIRRPPS